MIPEPAARCDRLYVYGTLRRGFVLHDYLARLGAKFLTNARVAAELIDQGRYPGPRPSVRKGHWVRGELFRLRQPARALTVLDKVKGFIPGAPKRSLFVRAATEVLLNNGSRVLAWIYWRGVRVRGGSHG
jgi:gamma-glutamylcyclotransferase (GGCT)/AIG2-like uncharacterized protein YtfP